MKRTSIYYFSLAAILAGSFASCQDDDMGYTKEEIHDAAVMREYVKNFEARYGKIDPNHDWGLGPISGNVTRASNPNSNEWPANYTFDIPGYPDEYYNGSTFHGDYFRATEGYVKSGYVHPAGDVTDEEIMYVSWWFRTHRYPVSIPLHWTDFWMQAISADNDRDAEGYLVNCVPHYKVGEKKIETNKIGTFNLDQMKVKTFEGADYDHILNFNSGNQNLLDNLSVVPMSQDGIYGSYLFTEYGDIKDVSRDQYKKRLMMLYYSSGTEDFASHFSNDGQWRQNSDNKYDHSIWTTVHLHFVGASGRIYDGYYLGFDYAFEKPDQNGDYELKMDGYYSNWIVKLSPGTAYHNETVTKRIMCEDLGNTYDFDFDDVVFDVRYNGASSTDATITIQAAGGTMPIWVGYKPTGTNLDDFDMKYEIHHLLGSDKTDAPINVGSSYKKAPQANFHYTASSTAPKDIPIYVWNTNDNELKELSYEAFSKYSKSDATGIGNIPQRFGVPTSVLWMQETKQIEDGYGNFADWVTNQVENFEWYKTNKTNSLLWGTEGEPSKDIVIGGVSSTVSPLIPDSESEGFHYDVYLKKGAKGETEPLWEDLTPNTKITVTIPAGYSKCWLFGSYKIGNTTHRMKENDVISISAATEIEVLGQVYILAEN